MIFENYLSNLSSEELQERVGDPRQLAYVDFVEKLDGPAKGVRKAIFRTARGLVFDALIERSLDISSCYYKGCPLAWRSPVLETHPSCYDPRGDEWLRSFFGGLLTTCGLTHFGHPSSNGQDFGLHGRISNIPAEKISFKSGWQGGEYILGIKGKMRQAKVLGENLILVREIKTAMHKKSIEIHDVVKNRSYQPTPQMILYHINLGYPLLDEGAKLLIKPAEVKSLDNWAACEIDQYGDFSCPQEGYQERVYQFKLEADHEGSTSVALVNPELGNGLGVAIKFSKSQLPYLLEWKMMGKREYVVGLEPANCGGDPRKLLVEGNKLPILPPQQEREYRLQIKILDGETDIKHFKEISN